MMKRKKFATVDVLRYPIFEVGTWNGMTFTQADLDDIVRAHEELVVGMKIHRVPLKLGHNDAQNLTDGQPALGWVQNVRRVEDQLVADFTDVPKLIKELIGKRRYTAVSCELLMGLKRGDKAYKYVLDAVAILGADHPAVHTLPDLSIYLAKRSLADEGGQRVVFERQASKVKFQLPTGGPAMDEETQKLIDAAVLAATTPLRAEIKTLETQVTEYKRKFSEEEDKRIKADTKAKELEARFTEIETTAKREKVKLARDAVKSVYEDAVKARAITPAQRDADFTLEGIDTDDERVIKLHANLDILKVRLMGDKKPEAGKGKKKFSEEDESTAHGDTEDESQEREFKDPGAEANRRARLKMAESGGKMKYGDALKVVFTEDPELHAEYANTEPPMRPARRAAGGEK